MAITRISPLSGRTASFGKITEGRAQRKWIAHTNDRYDDEVAVAAAGIAAGVFPIPYLTRHPSSPLLLCRTLEPVQDDRAPLKWIVTASYSSEPLTQSQATGNFVPPLQRPALIRTRKNKYQKVITRDLDGKAILNSAGDPPERPLEVPRGRVLYVITRNVAQVPASLATGGDAINSTDFAIEGTPIGQYQAKVEDWDRSELQTEYDPNGNAWNYYVFTWSFELNFDPGGWRLQLLDCGYRARRRGGDGVSKFNILDNSTPPQPITSPALLDGNGYAIDNPTPESGIYKDYRGFYEVDFNEFPLS